MAGSLPAMSPPRVLILSASVGEGHDLPARVIRDEILEREPGAYVAIEDSLAFAPRWVARAVEDGARRINGTCNSVFELQYRALAVWRPTRAAAAWAMENVARKGLGLVIAKHRPDVIVSTYPGTTEPLGRLRRKGEIDVPVASAITDLAALRYWASPGVDLHLIIHPESREEVEGLAPESRIEAANGMYLATFREPRERAAARHELGLPAEGPIVLVSGGGWAVGDLAGAVEAAREVASVVALCGRNEEVRADLARRFPDIRVEGFTDHMSDFMAAADVLVHSSAGLTVLEALIRGCAPISYGWGAGHIAVNNRAYARFGLARVADDPAALRAALADALADPIEPDGSFAKLPRSADLVLGLVLGGHGAGHSARSAEGRGAGSHEQ